MTSGQRITARVRPAARGIFAHPDETKLDRASIVPPLAPAPAFTKFRFAIDTEPPVAKAGANLMIHKGEPVKFNGTASHDNYGIALATWDVDLSRDSDGDGNPANDQDLAGLAPTLLRGYAKAGKYRARLTVRDAVSNGPSMEDVVITVGMPEPWTPNPTDRTTTSASPATR